MILLPVIKTCTQSDIFFQISLAMMMWLVIIWRKGNFLFCFLCSKWEICPFEEPFLSKICVAHPSPLIIIFFWRKQQIIIEIKFSAWDIVFPAFWLVHSTIIQKFWIISANFLPKNYLQ